MSDTPKEWFLYSFALIFDLAVLIAIVYYQLEIILMIFAVLGLFSMKLVDKAFSVDERAQQVSREASYLAIRVFVFLGIGISVIVLFLGYWVIGSVLVFTSVVLILLQTVLTIYTDKKYS